jgi:DNA-binding GntR family transcriptional regulator
VQRRTPAARAARHSPFRSSPAIGHLLHTFELASVLEAHAISRAAASPERDLHPARAALDVLGRTPEAEGRSQWASLEIQFHRALNEQGGNLVLASLAERTLRDGLTACPILSPEVLRILHAHHREILRCVETSDAETAARQTRVHVLYLRDLLLGAARGSVRTRRRLRLHS